MGYVIVMAGFALWILCGLVGVAWWYKYIENEFQAKSSLPFMYIFLGPVALITTIYVMYFYKEGE